MERRFGSHVGYGLETQGEDSVVQIFTRQAENYPERSAMFYFDTEWTWREYAHTVKVLANAFQNLGVQPGDRVIVMLQNMPASSFVQLALWWLGAIIVPLNVMYRERELEYYVTDSGAVGAVVLNSVSARWLSLKDKLRFIVEVADDADCPGYRPELMPEQTEWLPGAVHYHNLITSRSETPAHPVTTQPIAYLTYTSGTTGNPKGAINTHHNIISTAKVYVDLANLNSSDTIIAFAPLFHITGSVAGLTAHIYTGAPLVLMYRYDAAEALNAIERRKVTFTVGAITTYLAMMQREDLRDRDLSLFRKTYSGGAPVSPATVEQFEKITGCYIHNVYGLTESSNGMVMTPFGRRAPVDPDSGALSIGKIGTGCEARIVDLTNPKIVLPPRMQGELALRGDSITSGYWNRPEATSQSFVDGWFLTGDVATMDEDGWLYIVDRKKDLIITSGNKVWPREVEDALYQHSAVREAAVVGEPDEYRGEMVTAYVALQEGAVLSPEELRGFVRSKLAAYKVPRKIEVVDEIPKTATGKFLRRALRRSR